MARQLKEDLQRFFNGNRVNQNRYLVVSIYFLIHFFTQTSYKLLLQPRLNTVQSLLAHLQNLNTSKSLKPDTLSKMSETATKRVNYLK